MEFVKNPWGGVGVLTWPRCLMPPLYSMPWDSWFTVPAMTTQQLSFQLRDRDYNLLSIVPNISFVLLID